FSVLAIGLAADHVERGSVGQVVIDDGQIRTFADRERAPLGDRRCLQHVMTHPLQVEKQDAAHLRVVIDNEHLSHSSVRAYPAGFPLSLERGPELGYARSMRSCIASSFENGSASP